MPRNAPRWSAPAPSCSTATGADPAAFFFMRGFFPVCWLVAFAAGAAAAPAPKPGPPVQSSPPVDFAHLPWKDGESLTYLVTCYELNAAQGTFVAHDMGDHWEFKLALSSQGWVSSFYPFTGWFWCVAGAGVPWRSVEYGEYRFEPKRVIKEQTLIDYAAHQGARADWMKGTTKTFPVAEDGIDDVGTMLYHLRTGPWKVGDHRTLFVYESNSEKEADVTCDAIETKAFGIWPAQKLIRLSALPGKGTKHHGHLTIWMTDDARHIPIHAEIEFRYGTFAMDLTKTVKAGMP
jgi:hypothetical protein